MRRTIWAGMLALALSSVGAHAVELNMVSGDTGNGLEFTRSQLALFEKETGNKVNIVPMPSNTSDQFGQYRLWLAAENADIDVYTTDIIWAPQLSDQFIDLTAAAKDVIGDHFPSIVQSQTVDGKLVAMPGWVGAPALYYRKDLLEKYNLPVPTTWPEMTATATAIMDGERAAGNAQMWGFVFQGSAYEGLTCNALEWVKSFDGGQVVEADGTISINNENAVAALDTAANWIGTISPPGVLGYTEEDSRGVWQVGNAVFMRNWPYAYALGNSDESPVKGKFDTAVLPSGEGTSPAATIGGWNFAVSKYSRHQPEAIQLALFLASEPVQKARAIVSSELPTIVSLYDNAEIASAVPIVPRWKAVFESAVPRPSAPTKVKYNQVSALFWNAVHDTISGTGSAAENLAALEADLTDLKGAGW